MNPEISIIIPIFNAEKTLAPCLEAVFKSNFKNFEVIVVDDASTDCSSEIAQKFPVKLLKMPQNSGHGAARNLGIKNAAGQIIVCLDSDVVINKDTLEIILETFQKHQEIAAVTGLLAARGPYSEFFTSYKNLYMNYIFGKLPDYVDFLYTSICGFKKETGLEFPERKKVGIDTELGQKYKLAGLLIFLNKKLVVTHLKRHSLGSIIKNDFLIPYSWARFFLKYRGFNDVFQKKRFAHARVQQLASLLISPLILAAAISGHLGPFLFFILLNAGFFIFVYKKKGLIFTLGAVVFTFLDNLVMLTGILTGFISLLPGVFYFHHNQSQIANKSKNIG